MLDLKKLDLKKAEAALGVLTVAAVLTHSCTTLGFSDERGIVFAGAMTGLAWWYFGRTHADRLLLFGAANWLLVLWYLLSFLSPRLDFPRFWIDIAFAITAMGLFAHYVALPSWDLAVETIRTRSWPSASERDAKADDFHQGSSGEERRQEQRRTDGGTSSSQNDDIRWAISILGLPADGNFTHADLKAAHRRIVTQVHPDKGGSDIWTQWANSARGTIEKQRGWA